MQLEQTGKNLVFISTSCLWMPLTEMFNKNNAKYSFMDAKKYSCTGNCINW